MIEGICKILEGWHSHRGLAVALIATMVSEMVWLSSIGVSWGLIALIIVLSLLAVFIAWLCSNRLPRTPRKKIGFLVSISCAADSESAKMREDFIIPLRQLIKSGKTGGLFHFMELPNRYATDIVDSEAAAALRLKCHAHFMLWGRVRLRTISGKEHHVIDLNGIVTHRPIPEAMGRDFSTEFGELLPRQIIIAQENDLFSFQFTSEWAEVVARYIIGIAAAMSGDFVNAEMLYTEALKRLQSRDERFPIYLKLKERIPIRMSEIYESRAHQAYIAWTCTRNPNDMALVGSSLKYILESRQKEVWNLFLRAIYAFVHDEEVEKAIAILNERKLNDNGTWHYNIAFLYAFKGDLKTSLQHYRKAVLFEIEPDSLRQIEDFLYWVIDRYPDKAQIKCCLGFISWKVLGDKLRAISEFNEFLSSNNSSEFAKVNVLVSKWVKELSAASCVGR